ncbi:YbaK/prolyl-tRNA synthetase associated protein [Basidiobolus meristosporus CBS 931.73]|uniref:YbaK/prolyl-tRNA synthetase associated protein n=1 Tax=Basidiobolus meristosporus CBS 931.73 TaxID=1314790 RepID=A0A1Y1Y1H2_9FUNG|nr:YbaK/prolyl-tRNA synthetase associated protein [Basidiobolus meristosporus CBS 931.73]|eukprot:ORX91799.1 YbaK/prolyl-tRNA synthetase associated protein [Basidiobolus meristosporus CBS 931.73]
MTRHPGVERVASALNQLNTSYNIVTLGESARTAQLAAQQLNCHVAAIANSLIFEVSDSGSPLLILTSGAHKVDLKLVCSTLGVKKLKRATPEFVRLHTGFAIGGVAPVGHPEPIRTVVDLELSRFKHIWAAAGHPQAVFRTTFDELVRFSDGLAIKVGEEIAESVIQEALALDGAEGSHE